MADTGTLFPFDLRGQNAINNYTLTVHEIIMHVSTVHCDELVSFMVFLAEGYKVHNI